MIAASALLASPLPAFAQSAPSGSGGAAYPGELGGFCESIINGQISFQAGGNTVVVQVPVLPVIPCLTDTSSYAIQPICGASGEASCPTINVVTTNWCTSILNVQLCIPLPDIVATLTSFVNYIVDVVIVNPLIAGFNEVWGLLWYVFVYAANVIVSVLDAVITAIDAIPLALGGIVIGFVTAIPEPWSAFVEPWIWLIVVAILVAIAAVVIYVARLAVKTLKTTAEVGLEAV